MGASFRRLLLFKPALRVCTCALGLLTAPCGALAQTDLPIYTDRLVNSFQDWSWAPRNLTNAAPVHSGSASISVAATNWQAFSVYHPDLDTTPYTNLTFWAHGGTGGGQRLQVYARLGTNDAPAVSLAALTNGWQSFTLPLTALGIANQSNFNRLSFQLRNNGTTNTFYLDDLQFTAKPPPALVHLSVNATQSVRVADARWFGLNTAVWDGNYDTPTTLAALRECGWTTLRFPGGSLSDDYHWASNKTGTNTWQWQTSFAKFLHVATNLAAPVFITVNYGSGTPAEAAGWVRHANVTNHLGIGYWEIGNECYGTWETDSNTFPHDPYTYAVRARDYMAQMRAADPKIKVGVVVSPGEDSNANGYTSHPATNSRTGTAHHGWTPVLLATLKSLGATPDFLVHHRYPEWTGQESDPTLLQSSTAWAGEAADLRQQIRDYFGTNGANIELLVTENNSNSGDQGKQSTSLVNGLYLADSLGQVMQTEFNAFVWWDLRNGTDTNGTMDSLLYGWRTYGDLGMINGLNTQHPTYYAAKLMQYLARAGDSILPATSDYSLLATYAARLASGAVNVLVINKHPSATLTAQIALNGFLPAATNTFRSYGIPQDEAARTGVGSPDLATNTLTGAAASFNCALPPYSLTLLTLAPVAPKLQALPTSQAPAGRFVFQLQGQPAVRYVIQTATDFATWTPVSTNTLTSPTLNFTNLLSPGSALRLWRAVWQP